MGGQDPKGDATAELRQRIALFFSVAELRQLADALGVTGLIRWDRGPQDAARDLVRTSEQYCGLPTLVEKLREARPLVEWPDPAVVASPAPPAAMMMAPFPEAPPAALGPPGALVGGPPPPALGPPGALVGAPPPAPLLEAPVAAAMAPGAPVAFPPPPRPPAGVWPGTVEAAPPRPRGIDPRILIVVSAFMVIAALIAFAAGRALGPGKSAADAASAAPADSAADTSPGEGPRPPGKGLALLAAQAFARSLTNVATVCDVTFGGPPTAIVLSRALAQCGAPPPSRSTGSAPAAPPPDVTGTSRRSPRQAADPGPAPPRPPKGGGCIGQCDGEHRACKSRCGPEPMEGSQYGGWQQCLGRCLSQVSRCKLNCP
jgi:hypothetical protein